VFQGFSDPLEKYFVTKLQTQIRQGFTALKDAKIGRFSTHGSSQIFQMLEKLGTLPWESCETFLTN